jgi:hypothetical protein
LTRLQTVERTSSSKADTASPLRALRRCMQCLVSIDTGHSMRAPDVLTAFALIYLAIPNLIFLGGWLRPPFALAAMSLLLAGLWQFMRAVDWKQPLPFSLPALLLICLTGLAWAAFGGAGHFFFANPDWYVRDTVLGDLVFSSWPPYYSVHDGHFHILRSAIGYFLPAALVGKLAGIGTVDVALYLWTALGAALFLLLLPLPQRANRLFVVLLLLPVFFSGMDFLGIVLSSGDLPMFPLRLEWWVPFSYSSLTGQLYWGPNHAIALWLVTALFYRHWGHAGFLPLLVVLLPLLFVWTPFAVPAIMPFVALALLRHTLNKPISGSHGATLLQWAGAGMLLWIMARFMTLDIAAIPGAQTAAMHPQQSGFALKYALFCLMEFAILALLLSRSIRHSFGLLWLSASVLLLLPLYQYGPSNDTMLRLSTPSLILLMILCMGLLRDGLLQPGKTALRRPALALLVVLAIGAHTPFNEIWRAMTFRRTPPNYGMSLLDSQRGFEAPHYIGRLDRADLLTILREPAPVPECRQRALGDVAVEVPCSRIKRKPEKVQVQQ